MDSIEKQFDKGVDAINTMVYQNQLQGLIAFGKKLVSVTLPSQKEYGNLTGNTVTSYAFGIYYDGRLVYFGTNKMKDPVSSKLKKGEGFTGFSYDGDYRTFIATVDTDGGYGKDTSLRFLQGYKPNTRSFAFVVTTGTEYSAYLENVRKVNVLSDSMETVGTEFFNSFKPIR